VSLRDKINEKPAVAGAVAAAILIVAIVVLIFSLRGRKTTTVLPPRTTAYFTDDDGKTFYPDAITNIPPYQHNGKTAYGVRVFKTASGAPFVGYLERYDTKAKALIQKAIDKGVPAADAFTGHPAEVKKPGTGEHGKWLKVGVASASELSSVTHPVPPGGNPDDPLIIVLPPSEQPQ
jgi:hypothetical protein